MTDKERKLALYCLKANSDYHSEVCEECINYPNCDHMIQDDVTETIIKALEQEPCDDCISRQAAIMCLTGINLPTDLDKLIALYNKRLKALPPVKPKRNIVNCENFKFDEWDIGDKKAELWVIKGRLQIRHRGTIHNVDFPVLPEREYCPNCGAEMR